MSAAACTRHPARPAEGTCESCGRAVCLDCAVPFRGALRCGPCAARAVGEEAAEAANGPGGAWAWGWDRIAGLLFLIGVLVSLLPWDRVGSRTGLLSGWAPRPDPWPLVAGLLLLLGTVTALRPAPPSRRSELASVALGALATGAVLLSLPAPDLTVRSPVPLLVLAAALAGTVLGALGLRSSPGRAPSLTRRAGTRKNRRVPPRSLMGEGEAGDPKGAGMGQQGFDVSRLTMGQKILFVTGALFLIVLFLPWEDFGFGISLSGFSGIGVLAGILVIGLLVWEGINVAGVNLNLNVSAALIAAALAGATVLFGLIRFLTALSPSPGFGAWIGIIVLVGMAYGAFVRFQESKSGTAPPPPAA